jgi:hypothetical protein
MRDHRAVNSPFSPGLAEILFSKQRKKVLHFFVETAGNWQDNQAFRPAIAIHFSCILHT